MEVITMAKRLLIRFNYGEALCPDDISIDSAIEFLDGLQIVKQEHDENYKSFYRPDESKDLISYEFVDDVQLIVDEKFFEKKSEALEKERDEARSEKYEAQKVLKELQAKIATMERMIAQAHLGIGAQSDASDETEAMVVQ
jgi:hypothetical protein